MKQSSDKNIVCITNEPRNTHNLSLSYHCFHTRSHATLSTRHYSILTLSISLHERARKLSPPSAVKRLWRTKAMLPLSTWDGSLQHEHTPLHVLTFRELVKSCYTLSILKDSLRSTQMMLGLCLSLILKQYYIKCSVIESITIAVAFSLAIPSVLSKVIFYHRTRTR